MVWRVAIVRPGRIALRRAATTSTRRSGLGGIRVRDHADLIKCSM